MKKINIKTLLTITVAILLIDKTHLVVAKGLIHQDVSPKCFNEESSTERRSYNRQVKRSPPL